MVADWVWETVQDAEFSIITTPVRNQLKIRLCANTLISGHFPPARTDVGF